MRTSNQGYICLSFRSLALLSLGVALAAIVALNSFEVAAEHQALWTAYGTDGVGVLLEDIDRQEQIDESSARVFALLSS